MAAPFEPARTIDDVVARLQAIVAEARERRHRLGFFASLYLRTTLRVRDGIHSGRFEDPDRMERLDVDFANRYLRAVHVHRQRGIPTAAWSYAFARADEPRHLVLQHLALGMNAHINLDLGIAACTTCSGTDLRLLREDFFEINAILAEMIDTVQDDLSTISPLLGWVDRLGGRADERLMHGFLRRSRAAAWNRAVALAPLQGDERRRAIDRFDRFTTRLSGRLCPPTSRRPGWIAYVQQKEIDDIDRIYDVLGP